MSDSVITAVITSIVTLLGVLAALAVGCGDRSNLIPQSRADSLQQQLSDIKSRIDQGDCDGITGDVRQFRTAVTDGLSSKVDRELRQRLRQGADSLLDTAADACAAARLAQTQTTDTQTTETQTTDTTTVETQTQAQTQTQTTETPTTETPTTETPTTTEPPATTAPDGVTGTTPDNGNGGVVTPDDGTATP